MRIQSFVLLLFMSLSAFSSTKKIHCTSDYSVLEMGDVSIEIIQNEKNLSSYINGKLSNSDVLVSSYIIKDGIQYPLSSDKSDYSSYNFGEKILSTIFDQENGFQIPGEDQDDFILPSEISFELNRVKELKIYDLIQGNDSHRNKFGGQILMEAFDEDQNLLGRAVRILLTKACL